METNSVDNKRQHHRSESVNELFCALAKAQGEMKPADLDSKNPYFKSKYADLAKVVSASRPYLTKNGLSVLQQIVTDDQGTIMLHTVLGHSSGQWIEATIKVVPPKNDIQTLGSYITYLRRYSYAALVGVVAGDEDDDGQQAVAVTRPETVETISHEQLEKLEDELSDYPEINTMILQGLKIKSLADMPKAKYSASIKRVKEIKNLK